MIDSTFTFRLPGVDKMLYCTIAEDLGTDLSTLFRLILNEYLDTNSATDTKIYLALKERGIDLKELKENEIQLGRQKLIRKQLKMSKIKLYAVPNFIRESIIFLSGDCSEQDFKDYINHCRNYFSSFPKPERLIEVLDTIESIGFKRTKEFFLGEFNHPHKFVRIRVEGLIKSLNIYCGIKEKITETELVVLPYGEST